MKLENKKRQFRLGTTFLFSVDIDRVPLYIPGKKK